MLRTLSALVAGATVCAVGLMSAAAQESGKSQKPEIPGGIEGHVKSVDTEKQTLRITTSDGKERTFAITEDTTMLGPRGGKVRQGLRDRRFQEGMEITVVANGGTAKELHLGYSRRERGDSPTSPKASAKPKVPATGATSQAASTDRQEFG